MAFFSLPTKFILCMFFTSLVFQTTYAQLSSNFYATSCPNALSTIQTAIDNAVSSQARVGASLLRLHFHDCFVNGCDASVLLDDTGSFTGEKTANANRNSLTQASLNLVDTIKSQLETLCPSVVSCADILAVAARDSVVALGGPTWTVQLGRRDSPTASLSAANSDLPGPNTDLRELLTSFSNKGFNPNELVALSGAHTIGQGRCTTFRTRIYNETNINAAFATSRRANCPSAGGDNNLAPIDSSPTSFDNAYFTDLENQRGLFHSDQELFNGGSTDSQVAAYSANSATFFTDFANAMVKMGNMDPLTGSSGQIRTNCRRVN